MCSFGFAQDKIVARLESSPSQLFYVFPTSILPQRNRHLKEVAGKTKSPTRGGAFAVSAPSLTAIRATLSAPIPLSPQPSRPDNLRSVPLRGIVADIERSTDRRHRMAWRAVHHAVIPAVKRVRVFLQANTLWLSVPKVDNRASSLVAVDTRPGVRGVLVRAWHAIGELPRRIRHNGRTPVRGVGGIRPFKLLRPDDEGKKDGN